MDAESLEVGFQNPLEEDHVVESRYETIQHADERVVVLPGDVLGGAARGNVGEQQLDEFLSIGRLNWFVAQVEILRAKAMLQPHFLELLYGDSGVECRGCVVPGVVVPGVRKRRRVVQVAGIIITEMVVDISRSSMKVEFCRPDLPMALGQ